MPMMMNRRIMKAQISQELMFSYFAGRATVFQKQLIDDWVKNADNREQFFKWLEIWESQNPQYIADVQEVLELHQMRLAQNPKKTASVPLIVRAKAHLYALLGCNAKQ
jgi:transmembrane sensor